MDGPATLLARALARIEEALRHRESRRLPLERWRFKAEVLADAAFRPVFFLSTGRTGTGFFTALLNRGRGVRAWHEPDPPLTEQGRVAYELYTVDHRAGGTARLALDRALAQVVLAGRERLWHETHVRHRRYVETNNRITFFAPALRHLLPGARFVHVYRHPADVIRSGLRRRWYAGGTPHDPGRIRPVAGDRAAAGWASMDAVERIAWLWDETNAFIEWSLSGLIEGEQFMRCDFSVATPASVAAVARFAGADLPEPVVAAALRVPVNAEPGSEVPRYSEWPPEWRAMLARQCGARAAAYGYSLPSR
jgi:hypothetical protein